jgi:hypothetical protein
MTFINVCKGIKTLYLIKTSKVDGQEQIIISRFASDWNYREDVIQVGRTTREKELHSCSNAVSKTKI